MLQIVARRVSFLERPAMSLVDGSSQGLLFA